MKKKGIFMTKVITTLDMKYALIKNRKRQREMSRDLGIPFKRLSAIINGKINPSEDEKISISSYNETDYEILWGEGGILHPMTTQENTLFIIFHNELRLKREDFVRAIYIPERPEKDAIRKNQQKFENNEDPCAGCLYQGGYCDGRCDECLLEACPFPYDKCPFDECHGGEAF